MDPSGNPRTGFEAQDQVDRGAAAEGLGSINRRDWLRLSVGGGAGLAIGELLDLPTVRAATQNKARRHQGVHDLVQLLLVRLWHGSDSTRREADHHGG
jgi:hypothetical protein